MINVPKDAVNCFSNMENSDEKMGEDVKSTNEEPDNETIKITCKLNGEINGNDSTFDIVKKISSTEEKDDDTAAKKSISITETSTVTDKSTKDTKIADEKSHDRCDVDSSEIQNSKRDNNSRTKSVSETVTHNGIAKTNPPTKDKKKDNSASGESRPDTPMSHSSLDLDLEEKLLQIDPDIAQEDNDDFCEEKLLEESDEDFPVKETNNKESKLNENKALFNSNENTVSDKIDDASTDRQEKEIKKILKNLNDSLENKSKKEDESTTFRKIASSTSNSSISTPTAENSDDDDDDDDLFGTTNNSNSSNSNKRKVSDTNSSTASKRKVSDTDSSTSIKRKVSDINLDKSSGDKSIVPKGKLSDSSNNIKRNQSNTTSSSGSNSSNLLDAKPSETIENGDSNNSSNLGKLEISPDKSSSTDAKSSSKHSLGPSKSKDKENSEKPMTKSAITFSEALKSIAMEDTMFQDKPKPLMPTAEISTDVMNSPPSSLTLLEPVKNKTSQITATADAKGDNSQGIKRSLSDGSVDNTRPNLKRIRIFKNSENKFQSHSVSNQSEKAKEDEESGKKAESDPLLSRTQPDKGFDAMHEDELQRKTIEEMSKSNLTNAKLRRIKRKDLESLIIELFVDKVLYEHQLGQHKDLCKRLEATLENNRKKAAQFHKEIEDLKKVTQRLQAEHLARKSHLVAPVKVKRSVGIQATPTIIGKGMMNVSSNSNIRILSASASSSSISSPSNTSTSCSSNLNSNQVSRIIDVGMTPVSSSSSSSSPSPFLHPNKAKVLKPPNAPIKPTSKVMPVALNETVKVTQQTTVVNSAKTVSLTGQQTNPTSQVMVPFVVQSAQNANVPSQFIPVTATRIVRTPLTPINASSTQFTTATLPTSSGVVTPVSNAVASSFIDLTDDDEAVKNQRASLQTGGLVAIQRTTAAGMNINQNPPGQFVTLPPSSMGQLLLVPSPNGQSTTALVVGNVASTNSTTAAVVRTSITQNSNMKISSPVNIVNQPTRAVQVNGGSFLAQVPRHPAPLPKAPPQQTSGYSKKLPPLPTLKLSHKENSIVLSWNMAKTDEHERIASYQIYAYQEGATPPTPALWKKVGSVKALELPMACTLTQFMPGHVYHFAVRAVDIRSRLGPFSDPKSIRLGK